MDLATFIFKANITHGRVAKDLGVSMQHINAVSRRRVRPSAKLCKEIEVYTRGFVTVAEMMAGWEETEKPDPLEKFFAENKLEQYTCAI